MSGERGVDLGQLDPTQRRAPEGPESGCVVGPTLGMGGGQLQEQEQTIAPVAEEKDFGVGRFGEPRFFGPQPLRAVCFVRNVFLCEGRRRQFCKS